MHFHDDYSGFQVLFMCPWLTKLHVAQTLNGQRHQPNYSYKKTRKKTLSHHGKSSLVTVGCHPFPCRRRRRRRRRRRGTIVVLLPVTCRFLQIVETVPFVVADLGVARRACFSPSSLCGHPCVSSSSYNLCLFACFLNNRLNVKIIASTKKLFNLRS